MSGEIYCNRLPKIMIGGAGRFLHLEKGEEISRHILGFMDRKPKS